MSEINGTTQKRAILIAVTNQTINFNGVVKNITFSNISSNGANILVKLSEEEIVDMNDLNTIKLTENNPLFPVQKNVPIGKVQLMSDLDAEICWDYF